MRLSCAGLLIFSCFVVLASIECTMHGAKVWEKQGRKDAKNERRKQDSNETSKHNGGEVTKPTSEFVGNDPAVSGFSDPRRKLAALDQLCTSHLSIAGSVYRIVHPSLVFVACAGTFVERNTFY